MHDKVGTGLDRPRAEGSHVRAGLVVSAQSCAWTVAASAVALLIGARSHSSVLVAFGAIGFVDAVGSAALVLHFLHGLRHDLLSARLERLAHRVVLVGLLIVGTAAFVGGLVRLRAGSSSNDAPAGVLLAAISLVALGVLSVRKRAVARRVGSGALASDAHLSMIGAFQAGVTLAGTLLGAVAGWRWADAAATSAVGSVAVILAIATRTTGAGPRFARRSRPARRGP